jgi:metallo-beta-lactamase family protein
MEKKIVLCSFGAAETVTGSKHLLTTPELHLLIDCGMFQGIKSLREKNWAPFPIHIGSIDTMILTHAHLDHCGAIPLLVRQGFRGKIYMTPPTRELAELILFDSAKIQEEDAKRANRYGYSKHHPARPLYTSEDVQQCLGQFETVEHSTPVTLSPNIRFEFRKNGHILGSCAVEMDCYGKKIIFSGDIGRYHSDFLLPPASIKGADIVVMESTYGDRLHPDADPGEQLAQVINQTVEGGGSVLMPSFAVGRAQGVMHLVNELKKQNRIPTNLPVYLDSPMASNATDILCRFAKWHKLSHDQCMSVCHDVRINRDYRNTAKIIADPQSKVVIAASGMLTGGRVLEYLKHYGPQRQNTILLIGYQGEGTRGRALQNGTREIKMHGEYHPIRARVVEISGLSAHADQAELLRWLHDFEQTPGQVYLVHGEPAAQAALRTKIQHEFHRPVVIVEENVEYTLFNAESYAHPA